MPFTETNFVRTGLSGTITTLYTVLVGNTGVMKSVTISNTDSATRELSVYLVPSGSSASTSNALYYQVPIRAKSILQWDGYQVMDAGTTIRGSASGNVTIHISGAIL